MLCTLVGEVATARGLEEEAHSTFKSAPGVVSDQRLRTIRSAEQPAPSAAHAPWSEMRSSI